MPIDLPYFTAIVMNSARRLTILDGLGNREQDVHQTKATHYAAHKIVHKKFSQRRESHQERIVVPEGCPRRNHQYNADLQPEEHHDGKKDSASPDFPSARLARPRRHNQDWTVRFRREAPLRP